MQESGFTSWTEFLRQLGAEGTPIDTLDVSYRSSREIMDFATSVLGDLRESESAPRLGYNQGFEPAPRTCLRPGPASPFATGL